MDLAGMGVSAEAIEKGIVDIVKSQAATYGKDENNLRCIVHFQIEEKEGLFGKKKTVEKVRLTTLFADQQLKKLVPLRKAQPIKEITFLDQLGTISKMFKEIMQTFCDGEAKVCERSEIGISFKVEKSKQLEEGAKNEFQYKLIVTAVKNFTTLIEEISLKEIFES